MANKNEIKSYFLGYIALDEVDAARKAAKLNDLLKVHHYENVAFEGAFMRAVATNYIGNCGVTVESNIFTKKEMKQKVSNALLFDF